MKGLSPLLALCLLSALALAQPALAQADQTPAHGEWVDVHTPPTENECRSYIEKALKEQRSHTETSGDDIIDETEYLSEGTAQEETKEVEDESKPDDIHLTPETIGDEDKTVEDSIDTDKTENDGEADQQEVSMKSEEGGVDVGETVADSKTSEEYANDDTSKEVEEEQSKEDEKEALGSDENILETDDRLPSGESIEEILVDDVSSEDNHNKDGEDNIVENENKSEEINSQSLEEGGEHETEQENELEAEIETDENTEQGAEEGTKDTIENEAVDDENVDLPNENEDTIATTLEELAEGAGDSINPDSNEELSPDEIENSDADVKESLIMEKRSVASGEDETPEITPETPDNRTDDEIEVVMDSDDNLPSGDETSESEMPTEKHPESIESVTEEKEIDVVEEEEITKTEPSVGQINETVMQVEQEETINESEDSQKGAHIPEDEDSSLNEAEISKEANGTAEADKDVEEEGIIEEIEETSVDGEEAESPDEEDLAVKMEIPANLRPRNHIAEILQLDPDSMERDAQIRKAEESTLKELKRLYEAAIKPLEILFKYRDLSNRHFGDPEIFSKPLILFMGPWSGGKSTIINYLLDNEYKKTALRTGAEPSPAYFNIAMWGERDEVLDGTQLAADWTFSALAKFGQGLVDRLRGLKLNHSLLEKVNIVEIPGILEIRKQVERLFPFNDACQWFIDRADIIFLVYDPSKLDVGPETEAILDQLKGREYQTKIILNKADQVRPEELMRVQGTLVWNISPLMSSTEPPVMYSTSLWSAPYQSGAPVRLLFAQEKAFLRDLRDAIDNRVENKISSARRFAVRVRNHAKMVDCYLTTYYNHKSFFGNKKKVSDDIIEHPQNYHIYEGLSTLTNISRYDLPDPDVYRDFFRLNPVYEFQQLASTCTYFRGCPINRLDVAIAYDLPELVGKYKKFTEQLSSAKSP